MNIIKRTWNEVEYIIKADNIILNYPNHKVNMNKVNLHYYHADWQDGVDCNLGDYLSEIVVRWMCEKKNVKFDKKISKTKHLYAIGSILQMGYQNATVWGTGFAFDIKGIRAIPHKLRRLDIRCVRGPETRKTLIRMGIDCPKYFADPAVLMPLIYQPLKVEHRDYLVIPHFSMEKEISRKCGKEHILSMNTTDYRSVIDQICSAEKVISSSLHGIILAESYGVPAVFYQDRKQRFNYKYIDWYRSTGRKEFKTVFSVEEGNNVSMILPKEKRIQQMQKMLIDRFPSELFE